MYFYNKSVELDTEAQNQTNSNEQVHSVNSKSVTLIKKSRPLFKYIGLELDTPGILSQGEAT